MQQHHEKGKHCEFDARGYNLFTDGSQFWPHSIGGNFSSSRNKVESISTDMVNTYLGSQAYESKNDDGQSYATQVCWQDQGSIASSAAPHTMGDQTSSSDSPPHFRDSTGEICRQQLVYLDLYSALPDRRVSSSIVLPEEPVYVNAKQYHGILRRRQLRAKAELENKVSRVRKPYLHESRHLHALRRARGCGGRFINTKKKANNTAGSEESNGFGATSLLKTTSPLDSSDHARAPWGPVGSSMSNDELSLQDNKGADFFQWKGFLSD